MGQGESWRKEEVAILKEFYPTQGIKVKEKLDRSKKGIYAKARKLGLKSSYSMNSPMVWMRWQRD